MLQRFLKTALTLAFLPLIMSCGSNENTGTDNAEMNTMEESSMHEKSAAHTPGAKVDPVCDMEKDETWTDFSVANNDTVWFCGAGCKQAFDARPEKYVSTE